MGLGLSKPQGGEAYPLDRMSPRENDYLKSVDWQIYRFCSLEKNSVWGRAIDPTSFRAILSDPPSLVALDMELNQNQELAIFWSSHSPNTQSGF